MSDDRDYFAAHALMGMLAHSRNGRGYKPRTPGQNWHEAISEEAYEIADAMMSARTSHPTRERGSSDV